MKIKNSLIFLIIFLLTLIVTGTMAPVYFMQIATLEEVLQQQNLEKLRSSRAIIRSNIKAETERLASLSLMLKKSLNIRDGIDFYLFSGSAASENSGKYFA